MERFNRIEDEYLGWLYDLVCGPEEINEPSYKLLMHELYYRAYDPIVLEMDYPRVVDGENLRYQFGQERGYSYEDIEEYLFKAPCSILELLIALARRCEDQIMCNPDVGDRSGLWFWIMITNLGLGEYTDERYDPFGIDEIIEKFVMRQYNRDGSGGNIFIFPDRTQDIRKIDLWYQINWFISDFIRDEEADNG